MTLAQLRYLLAIIDANLNITVAADRVHATQPGISKQLKLLEEELGSSSPRRPISAPWRPTIAATRRGSW